MPRIYKAFMLFLFNPVRTRLSPLISIRFAMPTNLLYYITTPLRTLYLATPYSCSLTLVPFVASLFNYRTVSFRLLANCLSRTMLHLRIFCLSFLIVALALLSLLPLRPSEASSDQTSQKKNHAKCHEPHWHETEEHANECFNGIHILLHIYWNCVSLVVSE